MRSVARIAACAGGRGNIGVGDVFEGHALDVMGHLIVYFDGVIVVV